MAHASSDDKQRRKSEASVLITAGGKTQTEPFILDFRWPGVAVGMAASVSRTAFVSSGLFRIAPSSAVRAATAPLARAAPLASHISVRLCRSSFLADSLRPPRRPFAAMPYNGTVASAVADAPVVEEPKVKYLKDYTPPPFLIPDVRLVFELDDAGLETVVRSKLDVVRKCPADEPMVLDAEYLELLPAGVKVDGVVVDDAMFALDEKAGTLTIEAAVLPADKFVLETAVKIKPAENTALEGLYMSAGDYCTQMEAEGFRRVVPFLDRPDVMSRYSVRVEAGKERFPVLLSNGNCVGKGPLDGQEGRHWAEFLDPFVKPCYLFALVAGDLAHISDSFTTKSGRKVNLRVFVKGEADLAKCGHAMTSLQKALKWEEDVYGLEYELEVFSIVAIPTFTMGAMEVSFLSPSLVEMHILKSFSGTAY